MNIRRTSRAFTLLEVMIAMAIFFIAMYSILDLMTRGLRMARSLQQDRPSPSMLAAELSLTNRLEDGATYSGDFEYLVPELYEDYSWDAQSYMIGSNGLFQVDLVVRGRTPDGRESETPLSILLFRPQSLTTIGAP